MVGKKIMVHSKCEIIFFFTALFIVIVLSTIAIVITKHIAIALIVRKRDKCCCRNIWKSDNYMAFNSENYIVHPKLFRLLGAPILFLSTIFLQDHFSFKLSLIFAGKKISKHFLIFILICLSIYLFYQSSYLFIFFINPSIILFIYINVYPYIYLSI